jgi:hopanoid-associated phosphorylase
MEARIAAGDGVVVVCSGDRQRLADELRDAVTPTTRGIVSFGLAGGLAIGLRPGACVVARAVLALGDAFATDRAWAHRMLAALPTAIFADIAGADAALRDPYEKRGWHARTGAVAVDMESHIAGRIARERGLPFAALRVVIDPVEQPVPMAALAGHRSDGTADLRAVLSALLREPRELPAVTRLAFDAWTASRALLRCRRQLGNRFAFAIGPSVRTPRSATTAALIGFLTASWTAVASNPECTMQSAHFS